MKGQLLLFAMLLLFSSTLFAVDENNANNRESHVNFHYEDLCDKLDRVITTTSSPAIIPDLPRVLGEQNNSDPSKKIKANFHEISGFIFLNVAYLEFQVKWTSGPTLKKSLFILFRNLRL